MIRVGYDKGKIWYEYDMVRVGYGKGRIWSG